jgi:phosphate transport system substrate-binding protein
MNYKILVYMETIALIAIIGGFASYALYFTQKTVTISGTGATFPAPLIQKWSEEFNDLTGVQVNYVGIGSGGGVTQHTSKTVDFGASDPPLKSEEFTAAAGTLHIPETIGGVVITYNLPGISAELNFTGEIIADIFRLNITKWNDAKLLAINSGVPLPDSAIVVCHRSDSSGTTKIFTSFLSDENQAWKTDYGANNVITWPPNTLGGKGNPGVATLVLQNQYAIGYVELAYAIQNKLPVGKVQNAAGKFIEPTFDSLAAAAGTVSLVLPAGNESWASVGSYFNLHNVANPNDGYPITSFSYILVYQELDVLPGMTQQKAKALAWFLWWAIHDGQHYSAALSYVPLPQQVVAHDEATLRMINFNGQQVHSWT